MPTAPTDVTAICSWSRITPPVWRGRRQRGPLRTRPIGRASGNAGPPRRGVVRAIEILGGEPQPHPISSTARGLSRVHRRPNADLFPLKQLAVGSSSRSIRCSRRLASSVERQCTRQRVGQLPVSPASLDGFSGQPPRLEAQLRLVAVNEHRRQIRLQRAGSGSAGL